MLKFYHGTSHNNVDNIENNGIDTERGCGELGQGFYLTDKAYEAFNWADMQHGFHNKEVLEYTIEEEEFYNLEPLVLEYNRAVYYRNRIKEDAETCTFQFEESLVWSNIVGVQGIYADQFKLESEDSVNCFEQNPRRRLQ
ncbi:MAG: hypothetical protein ACJAT2_003638 [Bacteriovoracaceae bacterium]|jgi:hypothetical protein